ncbi:MAG: hypothetical protein ACHQ7N_00615 [Candidatus Methylomirabilales bacterium]
MMVFSMKMTLHSHSIRDVQLVRKGNRRTILELLRREGPLSRPAVVRAQLGPLAGGIGSAGIVHQRRIGL